MTATHIAYATTNRIATLVPPRTNPNTENAINGNVFTFNRQIIKGFIPTINKITYL